jgi:hypothetical protein
MFHADFLCETSKSVQMVPNLPAPGIFPRKIPGTIPPFLSATVVGMLRSCAKRVLLQPPLGVTED